MKLEGKTVAGEPFKWASYRGRIVLIVFWATNCGPYFAELPAIKTLFDQYHNRGFDVVSISVDHDRAALDKFLAENNTPWTVLHEPPMAAPDGTVGQNALADYYGVSGIPQMFLVGRDGKVVSTRARGDDLKRHLSELLGPAQP